MIFAQDLGRADVPILGVAPVAVQQRAPPETLAAGAAVASPLEKTRLSVTLR